MKKLTISSDKYPGISIPVPHLPGVSPPQAGSHVFSAGIAYQVTEETANAVKTAISSFPSRVSNHLKVQVIDVVTAPAVAAEVVSPVAQPVKPPVVLNDDDADLVAIEVLKLFEGPGDPKTIAECTPILEGTAANGDLPIELRRSYLQAIIEHDDLQKGLKELAQDWLETLVD